METSQIIDLEEKRKEILSRFTPEFMEKYYANDATFHGVVAALFHGANPYSIIEMLIENKKEMMDKIQYLVNRIPSQPIVLTKEEFEKLDNGKGK